MATKPVNYNSIDQKMSVDPDALYRLATVDLKDQVDQMSGHLKAINKTWEGLKLSWAGKTADEAQHFNDQWSRLMVRLFGTTGVDPAGGDAVLVQISDAVAKVAGNFANAEEGVVKMFGSFTGTSGSGGPPSSSRQDFEGPITERNNTPLPFS